MAEKAEKATEEVAPKKAAAKPAAKKSETAAKAPAKAAAAKTEKAPAAKAPAKAAAAKAPAKKADADVARPGVLKVHHLRPVPGANTAKTRVGRGEGSKGKTAGRGTKGTKARYQVKVGFEGGQMPIYRRVPKRGFQNPTRVEYAEVNTGRLQAAIEAGRLDAAKTVDAAAMIAAGLVRRELAGIRLLGKGAISAAVTIEVVGASKGAIAAVEQAGGKVVVLGTPAEA